MIRGQATGVLAWLVGLGAAIVMVVAVFRAYQNPANVVQWLALLQLCR